MASRIKKFSKTYDNAFVTMLENFQDQTETKNASYNVIYPTIGIDDSTKKKFMFYGQAGYGEGNFKIDETRVKGFVDALANYWNEAYENDSPLEWVNIAWSQATRRKYEEEHNEPNARAFYKDVLVDLGYNTYSSFFWNMVYQTVNAAIGYDEDSHDWAKHVVWSNLYKIAPIHANPDETLRNIQQKDAIKLFKSEIEEIKPDYVFLLTNYSWAKPFLLGHKNKLSEPWEEIEFYSDDFLNTKLIVTKRGLFGSVKKYLSEIKRLGIMELEN